MFQSKLTTETCVKNMQKTDESKDTSPIEESSKSCTEGKVDNSINLVILSFLCRLAL